MLQVVQNLILELLSSQISCKLTFPWIDPPHEVVIVSFGFYWGGEGNGLVDIVVNSDILELYLILGEQFALDFVFRLVLIDLIVVNPELAPSRIYYVLVVVQRHVQFYLLKRRHHKSLSR